MSDASIFSNVFAYRRKQRQTCRRNAVLFSITGLVLLAAVVFAGPGILEWLSQTSASFKAWLFSFRWTTGYVGDQFMQMVYAIAYGIASVVGAFIAFCDSLNQWAYAHSGLYWVGLWMGLQPLAVLFGLFLLACNRGKSTDKIARGVGLVDGIVLSIFLVNEMLTWWATQVSLYLLGKDAPWGAFMGCWEGILVLAMFTGTFWTRHMDKDARKLRESGLKAIEPAWVMKARFVIFAGGVVFLAGGIYFGAVLTRSIPWSMLVGAAVGCLYAYLIASSLSCGLFPTRFEPLPEPAAETPPAATEAPAQPA